jgi:hypothetical protein
VNRSFPTACSLLIIAAVIVCGPPARAAEKMRFWNTTSAELDEVSLAPAGTSNWGPNQCLNDKDKTVEADERLTLKDVAPGRYDVRVGEVKGRQCVVRGVEVKAGGKYAFSIDDKELTDCNK